MSSRVTATRATSANCAASCCGRSSSAPRTSSAPTASAWPSPAPVPVSRRRSLPAVRNLDERLAGDIIGRIQDGGDFWSEVYEPFSRNDISRETVRLVIEKARGLAGKTMPAVARYLKAVGGGRGAGRGTAQAVQVQEFSVQDGEDIRMSIDILDWNGKLYSQNLPGG